MAVRVPDVPGGLASLLEFLDECDVNVEYGYCMSVEGGHAIDVLKVSGDEEIERKLADAGFAPVSAEDVPIVDSAYVASGEAEQARTRLSVRACVRAGPLTPSPGVAMRTPMRKADIVMGETVDARG